MYMYLQYFMSMCVLMCTVYAFTYVHTYSHTCVYIHLDITTTVCIQGHIHTYIHYTMYICTCTADIVLGLQRAPLSWKRSLLRRKLPYLPD